MRRIKIEGPVVVEESLEDRVNGKIRALADALAEIANGGRSKK